MNEARTRLDIKVRPGAARNEITGFSEGVLGVRITARPEKGKANSALIGCLSEIFGISKSRIRIIRGETSRRKTVEIEGLDSDGVRKLVSGL